MAFYCPDGAYTVELIQSQYVKFQNVNRQNSQVTWREKKKSSVSCFTRVTQQICAKRALACTQHAALASFMTSHTSSSFTHTHTLTAAHQHVSSDSCLPRINRLFLQRRGPPAKRAHLPRSLQSLSRFPSSVPFSFPHITADKKKNVDMEMRLNTHKGNIIKQVWVSTRVFNSSLSKRLALMWVSCEPGTFGSLWWLSYVLLASHTLWQLQSGWHLLLLFSALDLFPYLRALMFNLSLHFLMLAWTFSTYKMLE